MLDAPEKFPVLKLPVHLLEDYTSWLIERLKKKEGTHVVTLNAEMAMLADSNEEVANIIRQAELVIPDGAGVVLYLRLRGLKQRRSPGIELAQSLLQQIGKLEQSYPVCFYGGQPGVAQKAANIWQQKVPGLSIISNHGYLNPEEEELWQQTLKKLQPRLILIGLGVPRQEFWIARNRSACPNSIWIGVGGSFDIWAGAKSRAPVWLRENNLEWLYRLYQEPWRWRRMLVLPQFFLRALFAQ
ncbi:MAG: WecB/TagA/CpsF family glycosyltransferase [Prochloraceae cyanobacterium]|nr:WecB/TagA/CpsF family glycosyltransferase [Prochloraceae cyanobacterium]